MMGMIRKIKLWIMIRVSESSDIDPQQNFNADQKVFTGDSGSIRNRFSVDQSAVHLVWIIILKSRLADHFLSQLKRGYFPPFFSNSAILASSISFCFLSRMICSS